MFNNWNNFILLLFLTTLCNWTMFVQERRTVTWSWYENNCGGQDQDTVVYSYCIPSWCTYQPQQITIIITHYLRSLFTFFTFPQQERFKTERRTNDFTPNIEIVFPVSEDLLCHIFKHLCHFTCIKITKIIDHKDCEQKQEGGRSIGGCSLVAPLTPTGALVTHRRALKRRHATKNALKMTKRMLQILCTS